MPTQLISTHEAAVRYGVTTRTIRYWLREGKLNGIKEGEKGHWRIEWDETLMGRLSIAPINSFVKKLCSRHGDTNTTEIEFTNRPVGKELKVVTVGLTEFDIIKQLRVLSGGMTIDEMQRIGTCNSCIGYSWVTGSLSSRNIPHYNEEVEESNSDIILLPPEESIENNSRYQWITIQTDQAQTLDEGAQVDEDFIAIYSSDEGIDVYFDMEEYRVISIRDDELLEDEEDNNMETYVSKKIHMWYNEVTPMTMDEDRLLEYATNDHLPRHNILVEYTVAGVEGDNFRLEMTDNRPEIEHYNHTILSRIRMTKGEMLWGLMNHELSTVFFFDDITDGES